MTFSLVSSSGFDTIQGGPISRSIVETSSEDDSPTSEVDFPKDGRSSAASRDEIIGSEVHGSSTCTFLLLRRVTATFSGSYVCFESPCTQSGSCVERGARGLRLRAIQLATADPQGRTMASRGAARRGKQIKKKERKKI